MKVEKSGADYQLRRADFKGAEKGPFISPACPIFVGHERRRRRF
jgi:hypothetical protein